MNTILWICLIIIIFLVGCLIGSIYAGYDTIKEIKSCLLINYKYRIDKFYVINGSVDKEIDNE